MTTAGATPPGVVVVTGGGSGIGLATCTRLAADGFTVAVLDIKPAENQDGAASPTSRTSRWPWRRCSTGSAGSTCW
jgi:NAD(P)-dependent dehydrogenase (short-subunit alcohol dehydrogenase family)